MIYCLYVSHNATIKCGDSHWRTRTTIINVVSGNSTDGGIVALKSTVNKVGRSAEQDIN